MRSERDKKVVPGVDYRRRNNNRVTLVDSTNTAIRSLVFPVALTILATPAGRFNEVYARKSGDFCTKQQSM